MTTHTVLALIMLTPQHQLQQLTIQATIQAVHTLQLQLLVTILLTTLLVPLATHMGPMLTQVGPTRQHLRLPIQLTATPPMRTQAEHTRQLHLLATLVMLQPTAAPQPAMAMLVDLV